MEVSMQEFKSHLAKYVGEARAGQVIELTSHRKIVARLVGVPLDTSLDAPLDAPLVAPLVVSEGISKLLATKRVTWHGGKPKGAQLQLLSQGKSMSDMVLEDRI